MIRIAVLMGGLSSEHEISLQTGTTIYQNLDREKYLVHPVCISTDGLWSLSSQASDPSTDIDPVEFCSKQDILAAEEGIALLRRINTDLVYIALHGPFGEDGVVQGLLQAVGLAYTGSGVMSSALCMDKEKTNEIYLHHDLEVAPFDILYPESYEVQISELMSRPEWTKAVIKPVAGGSSKYTHLIESAEDAIPLLKEAFSVESRMMIQVYTPGTEVTCAVLDTDENSIALPPTEIVPKKSSFFDFDSKYDGDAVDEITPPRLPQEVIARIQEIALTSHKILSCSGLSRTDLILQDDHYWVLETNTVPGMTATSLYPQAAALIGLDFSSLLDKIIEHGLRVKR